jgi:hypothetical protein
VTPVTEILFPLIDTLTLALLGVASQGTSKVTNCCPVLAVLMFKIGAALVPDAAAEGKVMLSVVCCRIVAYMLGATGKAAVERGDPTTRVPTPQGESAVWLFPDVPKKPAPFRKLAELMGGGGGVTVRENDRIVEKPATLAVIVTGPGVAPAATGSDAWPWEFVATVDEGSEAEPPVTANWMFTPAIAGVTATTRGDGNVELTCALWLFPETMVKLVIEGAGCVAVIVKFTGERPLTVAVTVTIPLADEVRVTLVDA